MLPAAAASAAIHLSCPTTGRLIAKVTASTNADSSAGDDETELQQRLLVQHGQQRQGQQQQGQRQQQQQGSPVKTVAAGELTAQAALAGGRSILGLLCVVFAVSAC
jgi:hypothetical protein